MKVNISNAGVNNVVSPFLEQPWARSSFGRAWDGPSKYDLTKYNPWYFARLKQFAALCDRKGAILLHNCYMQHALLETNAHYVDFPWRPTNCIQDTGMPDALSAANVFYDVTHPVRHNLHRAYIRDHPERNWCLAETGRTYIVYALKGGRFRLDLSAAGTLDAQWFNPRTGDLGDAGSGRVEGRQIVTFTAPDDNDWALYLKQKEY